MISKSAFIRGVQCLKSLYLHKKRPFLRDPLPYKTKAKFKRGYAVGKFAQQLFPDGIDLSHSNPRAYIKATEKAKIELAKKHHAYYEVPFFHCEALSILDIFTYNNEWNAYEVKSSLSISETYLWDAAFQACLIKESGFDIRNFFIIHLNPEYILEKELNIQELFIFENVNSEIKKRIGLIPSLIKKQFETVKLGKPPDIHIGQHCFKPYTCDFLGHCWKNISKLSVFDIIGIDNEKKFDLFVRKKHDIKIAISEFYDTKAKIQANAIIENKIHIDKKELKKYFEKNCSKIIKTIFHKPAIPVSENTKPFQITPLVIIETAHDNNGNILAKETILLTYSKNNWEEIIKYLSKLEANNDCIYVFDEIEKWNDIVSTIKTNHNVDFTLLINKIRDVKLIFDNFYYFSPDFAGDFSFNNIIKHFQPDFIQKLKNNKSHTNDWDVEEFINKNINSLFDIKDIITKYGVICNTGLYEIRRKIIELINT